MNTMHNWLKYLVELTNARIHKPEIKKKSKGDQTFLGGQKILVNTTDVALVYRMGAKRK